MLHTTFMTDLRRARACAKLSRPFTIKPDTQSVRSHISTCEGVSIPALTFQERRAMTIRSRRGLM
jgi:hypothetical protein